MANRNGILSENAAIKVETLSAQGKFFDKAAEAGFPIDVICAYTGLSRSTVLQWAAGTVMPIHALNSITRHCPRFPNEIASILTDPGNRKVTDRDTEDGNPTRAARKMLKLIDEVLAAHDPASPGAERIVAQELPRIRLAAAGAIDGAQMAAGATA